MLVADRVCLKVEVYGNRSKLENTKKVVEYLKMMMFNPFKLTCCYIEKFVVSKARDSGFIAKVVYISTAFQV